MLVNYESSHHTQERTLSYRRVWMRFCERKTLTSISVWNLVSNFSIQKERVYIRWRLLKSFGFWILGAWFCWRTSSSFGFLMVQIQWMWWIIVGSFEHRSINDMDLRCYWSELFCLSYCLQNCWIVILCKWIWSFMLSIARRSSHRLRNRRCRGCFG